MNTKKNLTLATLAALLAIPAFGTTNVHAAYNSQSGVMLSTSEARRINPITTGYGPGGRGKVESLFHGGDSEEEPSIAHYNGHTFEIPDNGGYIVSKLDGKSNPSLADVNAALYGAPAENDSHQTENTINSSSINNNRSANSNNTQSEYQNSKTNNSKLVQTGENDGANKATALGAMALTASLGLMALSFAKKHKDLEVADVADDNVSVADGKSNSNDSSHYSDKNSYDMIMSNMFDNLSKDLDNY